MFGWTAEEVVGQNIRALIPDDRQGEEDAIVASISCGERVPTFETIRKRKGGGTVAVAVTVSPILDPDGRVIAASKIARDISDSVNIRKQEIAISPGSTAGGCRRIPPSATCMRLQ